MGLTILWWTLLPADLHIAIPALKGEPNRHRVGEVVSDLSFGLLKIDLKNNEVLMQMWGKRNRLRQQHKVEYPHLKH